MSNRIVFTILLSLTLKYIFGEIYLEDLLIKRNKLRDIKMKLKIRCLE